MRKRIEPPEAATPRLLTVDQARQQLQISRTALYALVGEGRLPMLKFGKSSRIRQADLDTLIAGATVPPSSLDSPIPSSRPALRRRAA